MRDDHVTTAADLDAMTPAERYADFDSRIVDLTHLDHLPEAQRTSALRLLDRARARAIKRIRAHEGPRAAEGALLAIAESEGDEARRRVEMLLSQGLRAS